MQDEGAGIAYVNFSANITGLSSDTRHSFVACASNAAGETINAMAGTFTTTPLSTVKVTSVANGASFGQSFAPGMLMTVFGTGLSSGSPQAASAPLPLLASNGTAVTINGIAAPLLYISATQINFQLPYEVPAGQATLSVLFGGQTGSINFAVQAAAPGIFLDAQTGHIVPNESAAAGSTIGIFVTGAGTVMPPEQTGNAPTAGTTPVPELPVTVTVGGVPATLSYFGIPNWSIGTLQINFVVPSTLAAGTQLVVVTTGGMASPPRSTHSYKMSPSWGNGHPGRVTKVRQC